MFHLIIKYQSISFDKEYEESCSYEGTINPEVKTKIMKLNTRERCMFFLENFITYKRNLLWYKINRYIPLDKIKS